MKSGGGGGGSGGEQNYNLCLRYCIHHTEHVVEYRTIAIYTYNQTRVNLKSVYIIQYTSF